MNNVHPHKMFLASEAPSLCGERIKNKYIRYYIPMNDNINTCMYCGVSDNQQMPFYWFNHYDGDVFCKTVWLCNSCVDKGFKGKTYADFLGKDEEISFPSITLDSQVKESTTSFMGYNIHTALTTTTTMSVKIQKPVVQFDNENGHVFISNSAAIDCLLELLESTPTETDTC